MIDWQAERDLKGSGPWRDTDSRDRKLGSYENTSRTSQNQQVTMRELWGGHPRPRRTPWSGSAKWPMRASAAVQGDSPTTEIGFVPPFSSPWVTRCRSWMFRFYQAETGCGRPINGGQQIGFVFTRVRWGPALGTCQPTRSNWVRFRYFAFVGRFDSGEDLAKK